MVLMAVRGAFDGSPRGCGSEAGRSGRVRPPGACGFNAKTLVQQAKFSEFVGKRRATEGKPK